MYNIFQLHVTSTKLSRSVENEQIFRSSSLPSTSPLVYQTRLMLHTVSFDAERRVEML